MDYIIKKLDNLIKIKEFESMNMDVACYNKIKMDYFLILTISTLWDIKLNSMTLEDRKKIMTFLQRPETGKLIHLIEVEFSLHKNIVNIFKQYKEGRNLKFGHTTFESFAAKELNKECTKCWDDLMNLSIIEEDTDSNFIIKLYQKDNDYYYISSIGDDGKMMVMHYGNSFETVVFNQIELRARMINKDNTIEKGDLFLLVDDQFIKVSPFIQYDQSNDLFMMMMDIEKSPLAFKMAYVFRTEYANNSFKYMDEFPSELESYFDVKIKRINKNGVDLNRFSQFQLFEQNYYKEVHMEVQNKLDTFVSGNMPYGAVRGVGGVGKTSTVFMWINRILKNEDGALDKIREKFKLSRIIFLSAKKKIYSRDINEKSFSNFYDVDSDVKNYKDIINAIYTMFHSSQKEEITFLEKEDYVKNYSNTTFGLLIIIDDYESLEEESREKIQSLKDALNSNAIKMLITTRFISKESKDIIVESLSENECANMTDYIFEKKDWGKYISSYDLHKLTGGLPLLIWYAKAFYKMGRLNSENLRSSFSGPASGLESYLFDNFVQCFDNEFTKNFLMIIFRYYKIHQVMQISKKIVIFLCLKEPKNYKPDDEEFYFSELLDLKLISINQTTNSIDYSPLMIYLDKTAKPQIPTEEYQRDSLEILIQLNEREFKEMNAVIESSKKLTNDVKYRILDRIMTFSHDDVSVKSLVIDELFSLSTDKLKVYLDNEHLFQNNVKLIKSMLIYLKEEQSVMDQNYDTIRKFINSIIVSMQTNPSFKALGNDTFVVLISLLKNSFILREQENITNEMLKEKTKELHSVAVELMKVIDDNSLITTPKNDFNTIIDDILIYVNDPQIRKL